LNQIDKRSGRPALNGNGGNNGHVALRIKPQLHIHELIWKELMVSVIEDGLQLGCAGGGVDLVIHGQQVSRCNQGSPTLVVGLCLQLRALAQFRQHGRQLFFRDIKDDGNGLDLSDNDDPVRVTGMHNVPGVHQS